MKRELKGVVFFFILVLSSFSQPVLSQKPQYASMVIDALTGRVLHSEFPDAPARPASLTKIMTLYLLFEAIESGKVNLKTRFRASAHASSQPPTKIGLRVGELISVRDCVLAMIVKSANDAAVAVGENLAGSEAAFAEMMNQKARQLGMRNTTFRNPSGWHNKSQKTTARDMAILGQAIYRDFPQFYHYFSVKTFRHGNRDYKNHNCLLGRVDGCDGIKTGWTIPSGFNLVSSAQRNGRRYIVVVLGGKTRHARDNRVTELLELAFNMPHQPHRTSPGETVLADATANEPYLSSSDEMSQLVKRVHGEMYTDMEGPLPTDNQKPGIVKKTNPGRARPDTVLASASTLSGTNPKITQTVSINTSRPAREKTWSIQVGSYSNSAKAEAAARQTLRKLRLPFDPRINISATGQKKRKLYRARLAGFGPTQAAAACKKLQRRGDACLVVRPWRNPKIYTAMQ